MSESERRTREKQLLVPSFDDRRPRSSSTFQGIDFAAAMSGKPYVDEAPPDIPPATPCSPISSLPLLPSPGAQNQKAVTINLSPLRKLSLSLITFSSPWRIVQQNKLPSFKHRFQTSSLECCAQQHIPSVLAALNTRHVLDVESLRAHMRWNPNIALNIL
jgi:hypothetical protein